MRRLTTVSTLLFALGCGATSRGSTERPSGEAASQAPVSRALVTGGARLEDSVSRGIESAVAARLGFPVQARVRVALGGDEHAVLYTMNALTHWLAARPDRAALVAAIEACSSEREDDAGGRSCIDTVLRDVREPELEADFLATCRVDVDGLSETERDAECRSQFASTVVFDVDAYCDGAFWAIARRTGETWETTDAGRVPDGCVARVLDAKVADLDADGTPEILVDVASSHYDAMRLVDELRTRSLTVLQRRGERVAATFTVEMASYAADFGPLEELRCRYTLDGAPRQSLLRECCELPLPDEDEDEGADDVPASGEDEAPPAERYPTALTPECGPHWVERYPPRAGAGFGACELLSGTAPRYAQRCATR